LVTVADHFDGFFSRCGPKLQSTCKISSKVELGDTKIA